MMKNYLVTGGTGFIGSNCKQIIKIKKFKNNCFDNNSRISRKTLKIKIKMSFI